MEVSNKHKNNIIILCADTVGNEPGGPWKGKLFQQWSSPEEAAITMDNFCAICVPEYIITLNSFKLSKLTSGYVNLMVL